MIYILDVLVFMFYAHYTFFFNIISSITYQKKKIPNKVIVNLDMFNTHGKQDC